tara:strand:+ start:1172 stop:2164 length:993 start_codon:yes stop_codon:yes gene_type:complete
MESHQLINQTNSSVVVSQALLRPTDLDEFVGQKRVKETLAMLIASSKIEGSALPHIIIQGAAGHGKTTLSLIASKASEESMITLLGPRVETANELTKPLLQRRESWPVLFIDEIHSLKKKFQEVMYPVMEDFIVHEVDVYRGTTYERKINPFSLIGATTDPGKLTRPFRDRFQLTLRLEPYTSEQMTELVKKSAGKLEITVEEEAEEIIAARCRNSPRQANNILGFCRRFAIVKESTVNKNIVELATQSLGIDELGLTPEDRLYLYTLAEKFNGGPTGVKSLSATSELDEENISGTIEPHLLAKQLIDRTPKGRKISKEGLVHLATHMDY